MRKAEALLEIEKEKTRLYIEQFGKKPPKKRKKKKIVVPPSYAIGALNGLGDIGASLCLARKVNYALLLLHHHLHRCLSDKMTI